MLIVRDYTDRIAVEYNNAAMSTGMGGGNATIGMEGFLYHLKHNDSGDVEMHWRGFLSDWKEQDSRASYGNLYKFIKEMQSKKKLKKGESTLYIRSDGCAKQYKCANSLRLVDWLCAIFKIRIDWMVTAPHHGKNLVDAIAGRDKYDLANGFIRGMDSAMRDEFFQWLSEARKAARFLNERGTVVNYKKPKLEDRKRETNKTTHDSSRTLKSRTYEVSNYDEEKDGWRMPAENCSWELNKSQFNAECPPVGANGKRGKKYSTKVGLKEMYHFRFIPELPRDTVAIRRIPCLCKECKSCLDKPWNNDLSPSKQPMFCQVMGCRMEPVMGSLNDWNLVKLRKKRTVSTGDKLPFSSKTTLNAERRKLKVRSK